MMRSSLLVFALAATQCLFAQRDTDTSVNRNLQIVYDYKPKFMDAQKIESVPVIEKPALKPVSFTYQVKSHQVNTAKVVNPIPMSDLETGKQEVYPSSFVKLGYGNMKTPLAEIYLNNKQNTKYSYGAHYRFLQTNSDLNKGYADFTNHQFKGYASTFTDIGELGMELNYKYNRYYFYGFADSVRRPSDTTLFSPDKNKLARTARNIDARVYFNSTAISDKKLKHRTQFNYYNFSLGKAVESQYALSTMLYVGLKDMNDMKKPQFSAVVGLDYNTFRNDTFSVLKRFFLQFDPRFDFVYDGLQVSAGFNTTVFFKNSDTTLAYVNPVIKVSYPIVEGSANIYAGIDGRYQKQTLRNIIYTNPFTTDYLLTNLYENVKTYLGVNAKMGSSADAVFEMGYSDISNMPLFVSKRDSLNSFTIKYKQISVLKFMAALNYSFSEKVRIGMSGNFYDYQVTEEPYAWQLPAVDGRVNMKFNINNIIYPHIDFMAMGMQKQRTGVESPYNTSTLKAFYDLSAGVDFRFKKKLSAFIQANNVVASRYQRWYNYPVYGFNIIGGITVIF